MKAFYLSSLVFFSYCLPKPSFQRLYTHSFPTVSLISSFLFSSPHPPIYIYTYTYIYIFLVPGRNPSLHFEFPEYAVSQPGHKKSATASSYILIRRSQRLIYTLAPFLRSFLPCLSLFFFHIAPLISPCLSHFLLRLSWATTVLYFSFFFLATVCGTSEREQRWTRKKKTKKKTEGEKERTKWERRKELRQLSKSDEKSWITLG